ncbi:MAG: cupin domain-containing protein [Anaerolineaceae bacterium]|nr:cupin domain-containing protein [Anaerolineaceae bacterium]
MSSTHHSFSGKWGEKYQWEGARSRVYQMQDSGTVTENWLIGKAESAENFALRFYEVQPHCSTKEEKHAHDHGIVILQGQADIEINGAVRPVKQGDVVFIAPNDLHVLHNTGDGLLGFFCIIPAKRIKKDQLVWAEGDFFDEKPSS